MTYQDSNLFQVENVGPLGRVNRMIVALTLVVVTVLFTAISPAVAFSIIVVSIYTGLTASIGWDPLYVAVKAFSQRTPGQTLAPAGTLYRTEKQAEGDVYKKAA